MLSQYLLGYNKIVVVANSDCQDSVNLFEMCSREGTLTVVFNRANERLVGVSSNVLWAHRLHEETGKYFGEEFVSTYSSSTNISHFCIANNVEYRCFSKPEWAVDLICSISTANQVKRYPVGARLVSIKRRFVVSPSSGFSILMLLSSLKSKRELESEIVAVGFGELTDGSLEHHWRYERIEYLRNKNIVFLSSALSKERKLMMVRSVVPNFVMRLFYDLIKNNTSNKCN